MTDEQRVSGGIYRGEDDRTRLERLVAIFEHSTDAIVGKTLDGVITDSPSHPFATAPGA